MVPLRVLLPRLALLGAVLAFAGCGGDDAPVDSREGGVSDAVPDVLYSERATTPEQVKTPAAIPAGSAEEGMRDVVADFYAAVKRLDGPAACELLTEDAQLELIDSVAAAGDEAADCPAAAEALAASAKRVVVGAAEEDEPGAGTGFVVTQVPGIEPGNVDVVRDGERWLIDAF